MTTKKEIHESGYDRGYNAASWQDLPELGTEIKPFTIPDFIGTIETVENAADVFQQMCWEAESNDRQFSPFEFTAKELNELEETKPYDVWILFEEGISKGITDNWNERVIYYLE